MHDLLHFPKDSPTRRTTSTHCAATYHNERSAVGETLLQLKQNGEHLTMLWTILVILVILWLLGFSLHIGGGLIHILLVLAVIVLIFNLLSGRRGI